MPALLDVELEVGPEGAGPQAPAACGSSSGQDHGFLSHEALVASRPSYRVASQDAAGGSGPLVPAKQRRRQPKVESLQEQQDGIGAAHAGSDNVPPAPVHLGGEKAQGSSQGAGHPSSHQHAHHHHRHLHDGFHTRSVTIDSAPLSLAAFQEFVTKRLLSSSGPRQQENACRRYQLPNSPPCPITTFCTAALQVC